MSSEWPSKVDWLERPLNKWDLNKPLNLLFSREELKWMLNMSSEVWMCVYVGAILAIAVEADEVIEITFVAIQDNL